MEFLQSQFELEAAELFDTRKEEIMDNTKTRNKIIAVDFDGTLVENKWPEIGKTNDEVLQYCLNEQKKGANIILWTNRAGEPLNAAVKWCEEHNLKLDAVNENLPDTILFFGTDTRKIFADEFIDDRAATGFNIPFTAEPDWETSEVRLAIQKEKGACEDSDEWDYGVKCYNSALRAIRSLKKDGHSGMSIQITKSILNRLIDGKCLTPIEDDPDIWAKVEFGEDDPIQHFQCKRMSSLFKDVAEDGTVTYSDVNRVQLINKESPDIPFRNGFGTRLIDKMYPITLPYFPTDKKFKIIVEKFLTDEKNGDFDTVGYLQLILPNGEVVDLNGYFKDGPDGMVRIEQAEYEERKANRIDKK